MAESAGPRLLDGRPAVVVLLPIAAPAAPGFGFCGAARRSRAAVGPGISRRGERMRGRGRSETDPFASPEHEDLISKFSTKFRRTKFHRASAPSRRVKWDDVPRNGFIHTFRAADVHRLIAAARRAAAFPEHGPEGWHQRPVDPCALHAAFPALRLRSGYTLRAYAFREGENGNAFLYAAPIDARRSPSRGTVRATRAASLTHPCRTVRSLTWMEVIDGDGSPLAPGFGDDLLGDGDAEPIRVRGHCCR